MLHVFCHFVVVFRLSLLPVFGVIKPSSNRNLLVDGTKYDFLVQYDFLMSFCS